MSERDVQDSLKFMREKLRKERKAQNMSQLTLSAEADLACNTIAESRREQQSQESAIFLDLPMHYIFQCQNCSSRGRTKSERNWNN